MHGRSGACRSWLACDRLRSSRKTGIRAVPGSMRLQHLRLLRSRSQASQLLHGLRPLSGFGQNLRVADSSQVRGLCPVGAGLPAIGCEAVVKPVSALCQTECSCSVYDCCAADRRQASSYRDCDRFQALVKHPGRRQQPGAGRGQRQTRLAVIRRPRPQALAAAEPRVYSRSLRRFSRFSMCNTWPCSIIAPQCPSQKRSPLTQ